MYNKLTNFTTERAFTTHPYCYWDDAFSEEEINNMCAFFSHHEVERATVMDNSKPINESIRRSNVKFFRRDDVTSGIFDRFNSIIEDMNDKFYNFILNGYECFQYTEYDASEKGEYKFHMDTGFGLKENLDDVTMYQTRKLSLVMCLNRPGIDFEGGQFYINQGSENDAFEVEMKKGRVILFPSFLIHRVAPVTKGKRKSLVVWVMGPKFR
jgi:PKHD-type hydroxylase